MPGGGSPPLRKLDKPKLFAIMERVGKEGGSIAEICTEYGIGKSTLYLWATQDNDVKEAKAKYLAAAEAWWFKKGQEGLVRSKDGAFIDANMWFRNMQFRGERDINVNAGGEPKTAGKVVVVYADDEPEE